MRRGTCPLCRVSDEHSYHALVACSHARSVWEGMRRVWSLPHDKLLVNCGQEWLLNLLLNCNETQRDRVLMLIWRIYQLRNDLTHDKEVPPVDITVDFLVSYMNSICDAKKFSTEEILKEKMPVADWALPEVRVNPAPKPWPPPTTNYVALSVDGSFSVDSGAAPTT